MKQEKFPFPNNSKEKVRIQNKYSSLYLNDKQQLFTRKSLKYILWVECFAIIVLFLIPYNPYEFHVDTMVPSPFSVRMVMVALFLLVLAYFFSIYLKKDEVFTKKEKQEEMMIFACLFQQGIMIVMISVFPNGEPEFYFLLMFPSIIIDIIIFWIGKHHNKKHFLKVMLEKDTKAVNLQLITLISSLSVVGMIIIRIFIPLNWIYLIGQAACFLMFYMAGLYFHIYSFMDVMLET